MTLKPARPSSLMPASHPPVRTISARPARMSIAASPIAWVPAAQAVTIVPL